MNPLFIIAVPLGLVIVGIILNSFDLGFNQPMSSPEQDPVKKLTAEKESYRRSPEKPVDQAPETGRPVRLVGNGLFHRRVHLALRRYGKQDEPVESNCRSANTGNRRRQTDGALGDSKRRQ